MREGSDVTSTYGAAAQSPGRDRVGHRKPLGEDASPLGGRDAATPMWQEDTRTDTRHVGNDTLTEKLSDLLSEGLGSPGVPALLAVWLRQERGDARCQLPTLILP